MCVLPKVTGNRISEPAVNDSEISLHHSAYYSVDNRIKAAESETVKSFEKIHSFGLMVKDGNTSISLWLYWL
jgi:hypothetical protein